MININTNKKASEQGKTQKGKKEDRKPSKSRVKLEGLMTKAAELQAKVEGGFMGMPIHANLSTKNIYQGKNAFILEAEKEERGYTSNFWIGFHQLQALGGHVKKGSEGCPIIIYREYVKEEEKAKPASEQEAKRFFNLFNVFNMDCVEILERVEVTESVA